MIVIFVLLYLFFLDVIYGFVYFEFFLYINVINIIIVGLFMVYGMGFICEIMFL